MFFDASWQDRAQDATDSREQKKLSFGAWGNEHPIGYRGYSGMISRFIYQSHACSGNGACGTCS